MKGRARPPSSPESEESWTVDCPCGVNYDDGEEMVDCDECGVWVHTGCCHILKGHTSYVCDKCKFKKKKESEESEVAQLLVELPSKTPPLEEKVFSLHSEFSREERAHVHGVPGGDPSFFVGVSPVFSRQLWKFSGYVPKAFQFNYSDLPKEKEGACILFADFEDVKMDSPAVECEKGEHKVEYGKLVSTDLLPLGEANVDKYYLSKEKQSKRDLRKEPKNRLQEHQEEFLKGHYHSKRRRDENSKRDFTSKKRSKSFGACDYDGIQRRSYDDVTAPLKSARIASRNSKVYSSYNSMEDADAYAGTPYNSNTKSGELGSHTFGFSSKNTGAAADGSVRKQLATKAARKVASGYNDQEAYNGSLRPANIASYQEISYSRKVHDATIRNKSVGSKKDGDVPRSRDYMGSTGPTEGKVGSGASPHIISADIKETSPRTKLNFSVTIKDQPDETSLEQYSSPFTEKVGKQHCSDEDSKTAARQQHLSQKQMEPTLSTASDDDDRPLSIRITYESHAGVSPYILNNQPADQLLGHDLARGNCQDSVPLPLSSPGQGAPLQGTDENCLISNQVPVEPVQTSQVGEDNMKLSSISIQTGPSQSGDLSSPTLSCPGTDPKHLDSMKVDAVSPPSERNQNVGTAQPVPVSKTTNMGSSPISSNKPCTPVLSKGGNSLTILHATGSSASKLRSKTFDTKKSDALSGDLNGESTGLSSQKETKDLLKVAGGGKSPAARAASHQKGSKQSGQLDLGVCDQTLPQSRHSSKPVSTSLPHKAGLVSGTRTTTLLSPNNASTVDVHMQGTDSMHPVMNDEELALLLHQELNSSPRVQRVARVRHGPVGAYPFSNKRSAMAKSPVAFNSTVGEPHLIFRWKIKEESHGESVRSADECETPITTLKQGAGVSSQIGSRKDIDTADICKDSPSLMAAEVVRHLSPGSEVITECQPRSDSLGVTDIDDGERRASADSVLTLPGLIEDILIEKGDTVSYDLICEEVLPHWSKLRKHNGERYAYTSHRQAVLDCLRNRSAWSHLIDRGPKTNLGRKRRRLESAIGSELEYAEHSSHLHDGGEDKISMKACKEYDVDETENWPLSDSNKEADLSLPEEVPKGKRKARRGRRLTPQSRGPGSSTQGGSDSAQGMDDDFDNMVSPFSEDPASSSEDDETFVHRGSNRNSSRHRGSSADSEYEEAEP